MGQSGVILDIYMYYRTQTSWAAFQVVYAVVDFINTFYKYRSSIIMTIPSININQHVIY